MIGLHALGGGIRGLEKQVSGKRILEITSWKRQGPLVKLTAAGVGGITIAENASREQP